jgi:hypothetical protein
LECAGGSAAHLAFGEEAMIRNFDNLDSAGKPMVTSIGTYFPKKVLAIQVQTPGTLRISKKYDELLRTDGLQLTQAGDVYILPVEGTLYGRGSGPISADIQELSS